MSALRRTIHLTVLFICLGSLAVYAGCEGTTAQGTLYTVQPNRELETFFPFDLDTVHRAAVAAVQTDMGYTLQKQALDAREGIIEARTAKDHLVRVETYKHGERVTRIEVFAGPGGNETLAREILNAIESRVLGTAAP